MVDTILIANAKDGSISVLRLHREPEPRLEVLNTTAGWDGCGTFAVDAEDDLLYVAHKGENPGIATVRLDRESGRLEELARCPVEDSMTYLTLTPDRRALLGASYGGGFGAVWPIENHELGDPHSRFEYKNLHCILEADGYVYAPALGDDLIAQFRLEDDNTLSALVPATADAPAGSGPRHLVVRGDNVYLVTEFSGEVIRYVRGSKGSLDRRESVVFVNPEAGLSHSRLGAEPLEEQLIWGADVHLAGNHALASERTASTLSSITLDAEGQLGEVVSIVPVETQPRGFNVTDDGAFAVVVGEQETHASLLAIGSDGSMDQVDRVPIGAGANWVRII